MKMTGKLVLAAAAVAGLSGSAMAADLYVPPPAAPAAVAPAATDWDGPYIGASVGYGWGTADDTTLVDSADLTGWDVGAQLGYNAHLSDNIVAGIEGDINLNNQTGSFSGATVDNTYRINWDGSIRGRLGVDLDGILPYVEAGVAFANATLNDTVVGDTDGTYTGWTAGAGVEFKVADPLSLNVEYRYSNYGTQTLDGSDVGLTDNTVKLGLNYHF